MFVFTLVQSRTHVDTVQTVLQGLTNSRHICWSHTMKVLGWHVTFARRSSVLVVTLRYIYVGMEVWSRLFAVIVQSVSVQQLNAYVISQYTRTSNSFAVVNVVKISNVNTPIKGTLGDVLVVWDLTFSLWVSICFLITLTLISVHFMYGMCRMCVLYTVFLSVLLSRPNLSRPRPRQQLSRPRPRPRPGLFQQS